MKRRFYRYRSYQFKINEFNSDWCDIYDLQGNLISTEKRTEAKTIIDNWMKGK